MSLPGSFVTTPAGRVFVHRSGDTNASQPPLVVLHGLMLSHYYFAPLVEALRQQRPLVLIDAIGFGESDRPPVEQFDYRPERHVDILVNVLDQLGIGTFDLFGHSMGGALAIELAARLPERVRRVVTIAAALFPLPLDRKQRLLLSPGVGDVLWHNLVTHRELGRVFRQEQVVRAGDISDAFVDFFWARFNRPGAKAAALASARAIAFRLDPTPILHRATQPILLLHGESDRLVPIENGALLERALPDAKLQRIPAAGHHPAIERTRIVLRHLEQHLGSQG